MPIHEAPDITKLRYVLYARKSTDDENRQVRSIADQVRDCRALAKSQGLHVLDEVTETKSAKKPGLRPRFTQMLKDIENGKYDAILCWHPDRLVRNMLEGGQIINMLDERVLQDIRFHSHNFSNDANGKMLLGMLFVFSKQYSDDLSAKVSRGVEGNFAEGKSSGSPKWGYDRDEITGYYAPNQYFDLISEAWRRRADGQTLQDILKFLVNNDYHRVTKDKRRRKIYPSINGLSKVFRDPFYYGQLVQATQVVDLRLVALNFRPMIDEATFNLVQAIGYGRTQDVSPKKRATFYPLHRFVYCAVCGGPKPMSVGKNRNGSGQHVMSYRCDNEGCNRSPRSLRARNVFNSIYAVLEGWKFTDGAYEAYSKEIDSFADRRMVEIRTEIRSRRGALTQVTGELNKRALNLGAIDPASPSYAPNERLINDLAIRKSDLERDIEKLEAKIARPSQARMNKDEFLNVVKMASEKMKAGSAVEKDVLCRILFLNVRVDNEKVVEYIWNEPFASLIKSGELLLGADERS